jgi:hypothetical protein
MDGSWVYPRGRSKRPIGPLWGRTKPSITSVPPIRADGRSSIILGCVGGTWLFSIVVGSRAKMLFVRVVGDHSVGSHILYTRTVLLPYPVILHSSKRCHLAMHVKEGTGRHTFLMISHSTANIPLVSQDPLPEVERRDCKKHTSWLSARYTDVDWTQCLVVVPRRFSVKKSSARQVSAR